MTLLLACAVATWFMTGLIWFVQLVHYPLFALIGSSEFPTYHREHSRVTMALVAVPMTIELLTAIVLCFERPAGVSSALAYIGAASAVVLWGLTAAVSVPLHTRLSNGFDRSAWQSLITTNWPRTLLWSLHALLLMVMLAQAGG